MTGFDSQQPDTYVHKIFFKIAATPLFIVIILGSLWLLWEILDLPSREVLIPEIEDYFALYGYYFAFLSAFIEGVLFVNWYFPGSFIIFISVLVARGGEINVFLVVGTVILGFLLSSIIDYFIGKYGWYKLFLKLGLREQLEKSKETPLRSGPWKIFWMYWHPNLGAVAATAAGILMIPFRKFFLYALVSLVIWDSFWGAVVYFGGPVAIKLMDIRTGMVAAGIWVLWLFIKYIYKQKKGIENAQKIE